MAVLLGNLQLQCLGLILITKLLELGNGVLVGCASLAKLEKFLSSTVLSQPMKLEITTSSRAIATEYKMALWESKKIVEKQDILKTQIKLKSLNPARTSKLNELLSLLKKEVLEEKVDRIP